MCKVLVVDNEYLTRMAIKKVVSDTEEFQVINSFDNGESAIKYCHENPVNIIFISSLFPGMCGLEVIRQILKVNPDIYICVLVSQIDFKLEKEDIFFKINQYLFKPITTSSIKGILNAYKLTHKKNDVKIEKIISILREGNYRKIYMNIFEVSKDLYKTLPANSEELKKSLFKLKDKIFRELKMEETLFEQEIKNIKILNEIDITFWLFNLIDEILKKLSIKKYIILEDVLNFIDSNIYLNISLNDITSKCIISQGYLSRIFKNAFKISVMEYVHLRKMMIAKKELIFSNKSIGEIAFELEYNESNYFGKVFKKYEKITPFQFRIGYKNHMNK